MDSVAGAINSEDSELEKDRRRSGCPVSFSLDLLGDRWTLLIIRDLIFSNKKYYGDFLGSPEKIATNILADQLAKLEKQGIVSRAGDPGNRTRYVYRLTQKGTDLLPLLIEIILWGAKYDSRTEAPAEFIRKIRRNKDSVIRNLRKKLSSHA